MNSFLLNNYTSIEYMKEINLQNEINIKGHASVLDTCPCLNGITYKLTE